MKFGLDSVFLLLASLLFLVVFVIAALLFHRSYREYDAWLARETRIREEVNAARQTFKQQEDYLDRLLNDDEFFERVVRQRLGYSRENEIIYRFDES